MWACLRGAAGRIKAKHPTRRQRATKTLRIKENAAYLLLMWHVQSVVCFVVAQTELLWACIVLCFSTAADLIRPSSASLIPHGLRGSCACRRQNSCWSGQIFSTTFELSAQHGFADPAPACILCGDDLMFLAEFLLLSCCKSWIEAAGLSGLSQILSWR